MIYELKFGTDQYYSRSSGDNYYCKSKTSTIRKLKFLLMEVGFNKKETNKIANYFLFELNASFNWYIQANANNIIGKHYTDLYIQIKTINLF